MGSLRRPGEGERTLQQLRELTIEIQSIPDAFVVIPPWEHQFTRANRMHFPILLAIQIAKELFKVYSFQPQSFLYRQEWKKHQQEWKNQVMQTSPQQDPEVEHTSVYTA
ncbi:hypothetical protein CHS0354_029349 [Potamilus streckersoni]|uniref:Uncharacterized protein n=1 Tax=Potamilus streckersoni TaxID=2493646 RepID=A0AAE0SY98_9BIVA|nr:hypothetical protein CHS0354_029349 [Potamilus streckersoni]